MIDRKRLLSDLKPLLRELEADLRARCDAVSEINENLTKEYGQARDAERTGITFEEWRADLITQVGVAWVLSCVFVRFLEDNSLFSPPRIAGPALGAHDGGGLARARDEWDIYLHSTPDPTHRGYLLKAFDDLSHLPGTKDVFGPHNPVQSYRNWLSGDAAQKLIEFFQRIDADGTGEVIHDFTDPNWDTRFLGDLYQNLSDAARKKYALLQTPIFVEEFILERTLEPAIAEFGVDATPIKDSGGKAITPPGIRMIDPACGSGHFLLGGFAHILKHWRAKEPGTSDRELVNRTLAAVHGVDLNPYAVAIARFRLLVAAMRECQLTKLADAPAFTFNLVCGDSLLHGAPGVEQQVLGFHELAHAYQSEDLRDLRRILRPGAYHAVVANPPYIIVRDRTLNRAYRERYQSCHQKFSLAAPFTERLFNLAFCGYRPGDASGFIGMLTANSFMRREFGKKLVEDYLAKRDLTHVIDTAGAYIPGHGTPTVIMFARNRSPVSPQVRAAMGVQGEPCTPAEPAQGMVWQSIVTNLELPGYQDAFITIADVSRATLSHHPWSLGGGGAADLKEQLEEGRPQRLKDVIRVMGVNTAPGEDDVYVFTDVRAAKRLGVFHTRPMVFGDMIRDWAVSDMALGVWPYSEQLRGYPKCLFQAATRYLNGACDSPGAMRVTICWMARIRIMHSDESVRRS